MCPMLNGFGVTTAWNLELKVRIIERITDKNNKHITW
jgi:hypothetical protein